MKYSFQFKLFGKKVQMFNEGKMGVVVEKEPDVICVYGTDENYHILCAVPLAHPKFMKGMEYTIEFKENNCAMISVGDLQIAIDYTKKTCANNKNLLCYGSEDWGHNIQVEWSAL